MVFRRRETWTRLVFIAMRILVLPFKAMVKYIINATESDFSLNKGGERLKIRRGGGESMDSPPPLLIGNTPTYKACFCGTQGFINLFS